MPDHSVQIPRESLVRFIIVAAEKSAMPESERNRVLAAVADATHISWGDSCRNGVSCPLHAAGIWQEYERTPANKAPLWFGPFWFNYDGAVSGFISDTYGKDVLLRADNIMEIIDA